MFSPHPQTTSAHRSTEVPAAHSPVPAPKTPEPGLHLPHLPWPFQSPVPSPVTTAQQPILNLPQTPQLQGQFRLPGQAPNQLPNTSQLPLKQPQIQPLRPGQTRKGLRRRLRLEKLLGRRKPPVNGPVVVAAPKVKVKVSKRVRLGLLVTRAKLRLKGVKTPSTAQVARNGPPVAPPSPAPLR